MAKLAIHRLSKKFSSSGQTKVALDSITLEGASGQIVCILGPNGSGKTTLLKICAGLILPDTGKVEIEIENRRLAPFEAKTWIGFSPAEGRSFYGRLTGEENLRFFAGTRGIQLPELNARLGTLSEPLGLHELQKYPAQELSAGMLQRLSLARALLHRPRLLLLDEPTQSLDPQYFESFAKYLRHEFSDSSGKTVIWATQNIEEAWKVAAKLVILRQGRVAAMGTPVELLNQAKSIIPREAYLSLAGESAP